jgi:hypothetical protein
MPACAGMTGGYTSTISRQHLSEVCKSFRPKRKRAQGRPGARCTRGLVCKLANKNAHEHTGSAETLRPSLRNGFTAYFVLSPVRPELVCHRHPQEARASCELNTSHWGVRTTRLYWWIWRDTLGLRNPFKTSTYGLPWSAAFMRVSSNSGPGPGSFAPIPELNQWLSSTIADARARPS